MSESLRDQLSAAYDKVITPEAETPEPAAATPEGGTGAPPESKITAAPETSDRARDDKGRFTEKKEAAEKTAAAPAKTGTPTPPPAGTQAQVAAAAPKPKPARPDSWKKDYWGHWDKMTSGQALSPEESLALADYMVKRETDFRHGVSAFNDEWNRAKPIVEAMQPFLPLLQQHGIQPQQWISQLGNAHRELALGSPEQKLQRFAWLAQQYGVPLQALTDQAAQTQYLSQGAQAQNFRAPQNVLTREEADRLFQERFNKIRSEEDIQRFGQDQDKHPHFEAVRETMAQLLEANLAEDLPSAYEAALRHPRHSDLWQSIQEQDRARQAEANAKAEAERLQKAKGKAVSVRSATPNAPAAGEKPKDRRSALEEAYEAHVGGARL